jgi:putative tricarboxylic transport membrane protein
MGPPNTPEEIVGIWEEAMQTMLDDPDYRQVYTRQMLSPGYMQQAEYARFIDAFATETDLFLRESGVIN